MANEKKKATGADAEKRKKITIVLIIAIVGFLIWQVSGMFGGGGSDLPPIQTPPSDMASTPAGGSPAASVNPGQQMQHQQMATPLPMSQRESELLRLQQQTQTKYIETMNELQMLKLSLEIAETNKNIMAAKLATIKNQKDIVDILTPPKPSIVTDYSQVINRQQPIVSSPNVPRPEESIPASEPILSPRPIEQMAAPAAAQQSQQMTAQREEPEIPYTVVSVSKLQDRWSAVIGVQGALFSIHIGDIIPADGSKVTKINSRGIVLEKNGKERKVSLVPII